MGGGYRLGIDLGTTYVGAALQRDGRAEIVALGRDRAVIPSVVYIAADGTTLVGDAAERRAMTEPGRVARAFKRRVGDTTPIVLAGQTWSPAMLTAELIRSVVAAATEVEGGPPDHVALCHPATWGPYKLAVYEEAARIAGLGPHTFVPEPVAAAIHYASVDRIDVGAVVAVYDLGGGTFDATILRRDDDGFDMLGAPSGLDSVGGIDFDEAVIAHVTGAVGERLTELDHDDPEVLAAVEALRDRCQEAKEALSSETEATIPVALPTGFTTVRLTREELEDHIRPAITTTVRTMGQAMAAAGVEPAGVDRILLVGGASRTPLVAEMLSGAFGRPIALDAHPKHAVALGAARAAGAAATDDVGALFAAVTSEIKVVDAPVSEVELPPAVPIAAGRSPRRPLLIALAAAAAAVVLILALLATRDGKKEPIASGAGSSGATSSSNSSSSTDSTASPDTSTDSAASSPGVVVPGGGGGGGGGNTGGNGGAGSQSSVAASSSSTSQAVPPGLPNGFVVSNPVVVGSSVRVDLSWSPPSSNGGAPITGYTIVRTDHYADGTEVAATPVQVGNTTSTQITVPETPLANSDNGQSFVRWTISARNSAGFTGAQAAPNIQVPNLIGASTDHVYFQLWIVGLKVDTAVSPGCGTSDHVCNQNPTSGLKQNGFQVVITTPN